MLWTYHFSFKKNEKFITYFTYQMQAFKVNAIKILIQLFGIKFPN